MKKTFFVLLTLLSFSSFSQVTIVKNAYLRSPMFEVNGKLLFAADSVGAIQTNLWVTDGTSGGTYVLKSFLEEMLPSESVGFSTYNPVVFNNELYFVADSGQGLALWKSDATAAGTVMVKLFGSNMLGPYSNSYPFFCVCNNQLFFAADDDVHGVELWKTDGTSGGTVLVKDIAADNILGSQPAFLTSYQNQVYFSCFNETYGVEIWKSDGTEGGTTILKDIIPGTKGVTNDGYEGSINPQFIVSGDYLFFAGIKDTISSNIYLYRTDGTAPGTLVLDSMNTRIYPSSGETSQANVNGTLMYIGYPEVGIGQLLYKSNGTPETTVAVTSSDGVEPESAFFSFNNKLYFHGSLNNGAIDGLCSSDGTGAGTSVVTALPYNYSTPEIMDFVNTGSSFFFLGEMAVNSGSTDWRLVQSNGLPGGYVIYSGASAFGYPIYYNGDIYFYGGDTATSVTSIYKITPATNLPTRIVQPLLSDNITLYPNPVTESLIIHTSTITDGNPTLVIYNLIGEKIYTREIPVSDLNTSVDVSKWDSGIYFCTLQQNETVRSIKFIVQH